MLLPGCAAQSARLTPAALWDWRQTGHVRIAADGTQAAYSERVAVREGNRFESRIWIVPTAGGAPRAVTPGPVDTAPEWSPDAAQIAYLALRDGATAIYARAVAGDAAERRLTARGTNPIGFVWSPDGRTIAYTARVPEPSPAAWVPPALLPQLQTTRTRLYLVPVAGGEPRPIPLGALEPEGAPAWMPDGRSLLLSLAEPFDPEHPLEGPEIYSLRLADSSLRRLTRHPGPDTNPVPSPDGSRIAWIARDAAPQSYVTSKLWVANPDASRARTLAGALDRDPIQPAWSSDSRTVYFLAQDRGETRVYAARNDGSARTVLSAPGMHEFSLADTGRAVALRDTGELVTFPVDVAGSPVVLTDPNRDLAARAAGKVEAFQYNSGERTIQAWLTLPPGFDPARKYPLLLDIEDEPRTMCGRAFHLRAQIYAAAGIAVLCANARGGPGYGESFGNLIHSAFPGDDFMDWMAAVDAVARRPYIDSSKLSVAGGLSAAWAIGHTTRFHAAIARRPLVDFTLAIATAPDGVTRAAATRGALPWADPEQYWKHSPIYFAGNFATPTLILADEHDPSAEELAFALRARKVETALLRIGDGRPGDLVLALEAELAWLTR